MIKHNIEYIKEKLLEHEYILIDNDYLGNHLSISAINKDGYYIYTRFNRIINGHIPYIVSKTNKYSIQNIKLYLLKNKIDLTLISNEYKGANEPLEFICSCGEKFKTSWTSLSISNKHQCNECSNKLISDRFIHDISYVKDIITKEGYTLLSNEYLGTHEKIIIQDLYGYKYTTTFNSIQLKHKPRIVSPSNDFSIDNIKLYSKINDIKSKLISDTYISNESELKWLCECGREFLTSWLKFNSRNKTKCNTCSLPMSEKVVYDLLKNYNFDFISQYIFEDLKSDLDNDLRFDFVIFNSNIPILVIEVDGNDHRIKSSSEKRIRLQNNDYLKNEYCKNKDIPIIRMFFNEKHFIDYKSYKTFVEKNYLNIILSYL